MRHQPPKLWRYSLYFAVIFREEWTQKSAHRNLFWMVKACKHFHLMIADVAKSLWIVRVFNSMISWRNFFILSVIFHLVSLGWTISKPYKVNTSCKKIYFVLVTTARSHNKVTCCLNLKIMSRTLHIIMLTVPSNFWIVPKCFFLVHKTIPKMYVFISHVSRTPKARKLRFTIEFKGERRLKCFFCSPTVISI